MITTEQIAREQIRQFCEMTGFNLSTLTKAMEWNTNTLYRFMAGRGSMTLKTYGKLEVFMDQYLKDENGKAKKL